MSLTKIYQNHSTLQTCFFNRWQDEEQEFPCALWPTVALMEAVSASVSHPHCAQLFLNFFFHLQFLVNFFPIASFISSHHIHFHYRWQKESFHSFHWVYIWMSSRSMIICFCLTVSLICQFTFCFYFTFNVMTLKLFAASITSIYYLLLLNAINSYSSFCSVRLIMFSSLSSRANSDVNLCLANNGCLSYAAH